MKTLLVNISPKSTSDKTKGHWHWAHATFLTEAKNSFDEVINLSNSQTELPLGLAILEGSYDENFVHISTIYEDARRICSLLEQFKNYKITIHIYEGSLDSLILAGIVIQNVDSSCGIINLHWADQAQLSSRSKFLIRALKYFISSFSGKIEIAAESEKLASHFRRLGVSDIVEYPVFSVHPKSEFIQKQYDVLVTADDIPELNLFVQAAMKYKSISGNFLKVAISLGNHLVPWPFGPELIEYLNSANFDVFVGGLSSDEYVNLLASSKTQILLYSSPFYTWGSSGRLLDGLQCRTKAIVPANTALADYVESKSVGWIIDLHDVNGLTDLLLGLMQLNDGELLSNTNSNQVIDCVAWVSVFSENKEIHKTSNKYKLSFSLWKLVFYQRYVFFKQKLFSKRNIRKVQQIIAKQELMRLSHLQEMVVSLDEINRMI